MRELADDAGTETRVSKSVVCAPNLLRTYD